MKKVICLSILSSIMLISCSKDSNEVSSTGKSTTLTTRPSKLRLWYDNGTSWGCAGSGGNCLKDVVVHNNTMLDFQPIFDVIVQNSQNNTIAVFKSNKTFLADYINNDDLQSVLDGNLIVNLKVDEDKKTSYLIFTNRIDVVSVYPIVNDGQ